MRISEREHTAIKDVITHFDSNAKVYLFGSKSKR